MTYGCGEILWTSSKILSSIAYRLQQDEQQYTKAWGALFYYNFQALKQNG